MPWSIKNEMCGFVLDHFLVSELSSDSKGPILSSNNQKLSAYNFFHGDFLGKYEGFSKENPEDNWLCNKCGLLEASRTFCDVSGFQDTCADPLTLTWYCAFYKLTHFYYRE